MADAVASHFWISSGPYFSSALMLLPTVPLSNAELCSNIKIYDCDGALANQIDSTLSNDSALILESENLLSLCKPQAGMTYAHVEVSGNVEAKVRLHTQEGASFMAPSQLIDENNSAFYPLLIAEERVALATLVNPFPESAMVTLRLVSGKRSPEITREVPGFGARVFCLQTEFDDYTNVAPDHEFPAYLRIRTRSKIAVQLIDYAEQVNRKGIFKAVT